MIAAFVVWHGRTGIGGAERLSVALAGEMRAHGVETHMVFVGDEGRLRSQVHTEGLTSINIGFSRGAHVLRHPRILARRVAETGADVAIIGSFGYLGAALRTGGFRGAIIGVEHGILHDIPNLPKTKRAVRWLDRASGMYGHDAEVAVSQFMEQLARQTLHARRLVCIRHGVRVPSVLPTPRGYSDGYLQLTYAGRLAFGKGLDVLLHALAHLRDFTQGLRPKLTIAGDGPMRQELESMSHQLRVAEHVTFLGWTDAITDLWAESHISVAPSHQLAESFGMTVVEAMASGRASIVTDKGALPELVVTECTGTVVGAGDSHHLARAVQRYAEDPDMVAEHGKAAHARARDYFTLARCADNYLALAEALS